MTVNFDVIVPFVREKEGRFYCEAGAIEKISELVYNEIRDVPMNTRGIPEEGPVYDVRFRRAAQYIAAEMEREATYLLSEPDNSGCSVEVVCRKVAGWLEEVYPRVKAKHLKNLEW